MPPETKIPNNSEIVQALKEFEIKSQDIPAGPSVPVASKKPEMPRMVQLVMKWSRGSITEQKQAEYVLLGFTVLIFGISIFLFFREFRQSYSEVPIDQVESATSI